MNNSIVVTHWDSTDFSRGLVLKMKSFGHMRTSRCLFCSFLSKHKQHVDGCTSYYYIYKIIIIARGMAYELFTYYIALSGNINVFIPNESDVCFDFEIKPNTEKSLNSFNFFYLPNVLN